MKTAIITGASRGIGLACLQKFLEEGWLVIGTYCDTPITISHPNAVFFKYDQSDPSSVCAFAMGVFDLLSKKKTEMTADTAADVKIDVLINNAGILLDPNDETANLEKIKRTMDVDLYGIIDLTERLLPAMANGSHIVNVNSGYGSFSSPIDYNGSIGYRIAKAALNMYTRTLAFRLQDQNIIISSFDPGWVATDMGNSLATETEKPSRQTHQPAQEVYLLVTTTKENGQFWRFGQKRDW